MESGHWSSLRAKREKIFSAIAVHITLFFPCVWKEKKRQTNENMTTQDGNNAESSPDLGASDDHTGTLFDDALACVRWDGAIDIGRLLEIEFDYNKALFLEAVPLLCAPSGDHDTLEVYGVGERTEEMPHINGWNFERKVGRKVWRVGLKRKPTFTDRQVALWAAVCARHVGFGIGSYRDTNTHVPWARTWLPQCVAAMAQRTGALVGDEIVRVHHLARALIRLVQARDSRGPFALPNDDDDADGRQPTATTGPHAPDMPECLALVASVSHFAKFIHPTHHLSRDRSVAQGTYGILATLANITQRMYETPVVYTNIIAPAEYKALQRNTDPGLFS